MCVCVCVCVCVSVFWDDLVQFLIALTPSNGGSCGGAVAGPDRMTCTSLNHAVAQRQAIECFRKLSQHKPGTVEASLLHASCALAWPPSTAWVDFALLQLEVEAEDGGKKDCRGLYMYRKRGFSPHTVTAPLRRYNGALVCLQECILGAATVFGLRRFLVCAPNVLKRI